MKIKFAFVAEAACAPLDELDLAVGRLRTRQRIAAAEQKRPLESPVADWAGAL